MTVWAAQLVEVCRFQAEDEAMRVDLAVGELDQHVTECRLVEEPLVWSASSRVFVRVGVVTWHCSDRTQSLLLLRVLASCRWALLGRT
jgi:hypothetical protein